MTLSILIKKIEEARQKTESCIIQGQVIDYSTYRFLVGKIKGLQDAIDIIYELTKGKIEE